MCARVGVCVCARACVCVCVWRGCMHVSACACVSRGVCVLVSVSWCLRLRLRLCVLAFLPPRLVPHSPGDYKLCERALDYLDRCYRTKLVSRGVGDM